MKGAVGGAIANIVDAVVKIERDVNDLNARELEKDRVKQQLEADSGIAEFDSFFTSTPGGAPPPKGPNFSFPPPPVKSSEVEGAPGGREAPGPKRQLYADSPADRRVFAAQHQASIVLGMQDGVVQGGCLNGSVQQVAGQGTRLQYGAGQQFGGQYGAGQQFAGQYGVGQQFVGQYGAGQFGGGQQFGGQYGAGQQVGGMTGTVRGSGGHPQFGARQGGGQQAGGHQVRQGEGLNHSAHEIKRRLDVFNATHKKARN